MWPTKSMLIFFYWVLTSFITHRRKKRDIKRFFGPFRSLVRLSIVTYVINWVTGPLLCATWPWLTVTKIWKWKVKVRIVRIDRSCGWKINEIKTKNWKLNFLSEILKNADEKCLESTEMCDTAKDREKFLWIKGGIGRNLMILCNLINEKIF